MAAASEILLCRKEVLRQITSVPEPQSQKLWLAEPFSQERQASSASSEPFICHLLVALGCLLSDLRN